MTVRIVQTDDIALCRTLRRIVFIEEQGISEADEIDDRDADAIHLVAEEAGEALGSARLLPEGKIGRVCVLAQARGRGIGAALIRAGVARFAAIGLAQVRLGAQTHALDFYAGLGFRPVGADYDDAGIPHRDMVLDLGPVERIEEGSGQLMRHQGGID